MTESHSIKEFDSFKVGFTGIVSKDYEETILNSNPINAREVIEVLDEEVPPSRG